MLEDLIHKLESLGIDFETDDHGMITRVGTYQFPDCPVKEGNCESYEFMRKHRPSDEIPKTTICYSCVEKYLQALSEAGEDVES